MEESRAAAAARLYNARGATYDNSWHPHFAKAFTALADPHPGENVLDLACGTGLVTFDAAARVGDTGTVIGIDVSAAMLDVAKSKKQHLGTPAAGPDLYLHDIADLDSLVDLQDKKFDIITCASALVLLRDASAALKQWTTYLKRGGRLVVDVPHERNLITSKCMESVGDKVGVQVPYTRFWVKGQDSLKKALEDAGLVVENEEFVEQVGYKKRYYSVDDADDQFVSQLMTESGRAFRMPTERREKALEVFKAEWANASVNGKVEEVDGVYVAVARKT